MKRVLSVLLSVLLALGAVSACGAEAGEPALRVVAMKGPTAMGLVQLMKACEPDGAMQEKGWQFEIEAAADAIAPRVAQGTADILCMPANLAATLYNRTEGGLQVLAVNTLGVLYIVEQGEAVNTAADLKGKTIYASGKGATPEYALNYILKENGIDPEQDVQIEWKSEHAECLSALLADENGVAMLPQPFVTTALMKNEHVRVALDLSAEWDKLQAGEEQPSAMVTGVVAVRTEYAKQHPEVVAEFLAAYAESVAFVNSDVAAAAQLVGAYEIVPAAVAEKAIPACNIVLITGEELQAKLGGYLSVLFSQQPAAVGGALPGEDFYWIP